jgi:hypothetical protein
VNFKSPRGAALAGAALISVALGAAIPAAAGAQGAFPRTTFLLSKSADGGFPDGPSRNPAVSHDQRIARLMAYESDATNIVAGDTNGQTDVFVVQRAQPWGPDGTPWAIGPTTIASIGTQGEPANGPSSLPSLDGDAHHDPHCVAFISSASNLVADDTNGVADAFVRDLTTNVTQRVSVNSDGEQANGPSTEVSIDGACERVAFTSSATNLALTSTKKLGWRSAQTAQAGGSRQVYVHVISGTGADAAFKGLTFLASANTKGAAANAEAYEPAFARAGKAVVFTSRASNLAPRDGNGNTDVFERTFTRAYKHMGNGRGVQAFSFGTTLVSATPSGAAGNGASAHPDVSDDGNFVAFETTAGDILPGDSNGVSDVAEMDLHGQLRKSLPYSCTMVSGGRDVCWVSKSKATSIGNGASNNPTISGAGEFVLFDSDATNLRESESVREDANGVRDMFLWNRPTGNVSLESRAAPAAAGQKGDYLNVASQAPATSSRGNYVGFVSKGTTIDTPLVVNLGGVTPDPVNDLVYVRYLGEK